MHSCSLFFDFASRVPALCCKHKAIAVYSNTLDVTELVFSSEKEGWILRGWKKGAEIFQVWGEFWKAEQSLDHQLDHQLCPAWGGAGPLKKWTALVKAWASTRRGGFLGRPGRQYRKANIQPANEASSVR